MLKMLIYLTSLNVSSSYGQDIQKYQVFGKIEGLRDGTKMMFSNASDAKERKEFFTQNGQFNFSGTVKISGEIYCLSIDGQEYQMEVILDNHSKLQIMCSVDNWGNCNPFGSKSQSEVNDFQEKIQRPFSSAWFKFSNAMRTINGDGSGFSDWKRTLSKSKGMDSLRIALDFAIYEKAVVLYHRDTMQWIISHPDSFYTPFLMQGWWPGSGQEFAYNNFTKEVRESYYGQKIRMQIDDLKKIKDKKNENTEN